MKRCNKCVKEKCLIEFSKDNKAKDGLKGTCRECQKVSKKAYYAANKDKLYASQKAYIEKNKEKVVKQPKKKTNRKRTILVTLLFFSSSCGKQFPLIYSSLTDFPL